MNKHILLVMKWLNDKDSVSKEELEANWGATDKVARAAVYWVTEWAAAYEAAYRATYLTAYLVDEYFRVTGEDRNEYEKELNK
jgi:hypothetical protein|tara:strand:- start:941 stop:1189 length:249 start_codon:yes stop_codon:yes gene_type:complete